MAGISLPAHLCRCEERRSGLGDLSSFLLTHNLFHAGSRLFKRLELINQLEYPPQQGLIALQVRRAHKTKKPSTFRSRAFGPSGESRTHGLLNPIQARYQTALHPDVTLGDINNYSTFRFKVKHFLKKIKNFFFRSIDVCMRHCRPFSVQSLFLRARSNPTNSAYDTSTGHSP